MTPPLTPPTPRTLAEQIGRHWAGQTVIDGGLAFVEAASSAKGHLYAAALPRLAHRLTPAASITARPTPATEPDRPLRAITLTVEAHATSIDSALGMLEDLARILWPSDGPFHYVPDGDYSRIGVVGPPALEPGQSAQVWRIVTLEMDSTPAPIDGGGEGTRTDDGQQAAAMTMTAACVAVTIEDEE